MLIYRAASSFARNRRALRGIFAVALISFGLLLNLLLVVLILGEGIAPARLSPGLAAAVALLGGLTLVSGLALVEPRRGRAGGLAPR